MQWDQNIAGTDQNAYTMFNQVGQQLGLSPDEIYNYWSSQGNQLYGAGYGTADSYGTSGDTLRNMIVASGGDPTQYQGVLDYYTNKQQEMEALNAADGFDMTWLALLAAAVGGGALLGGGFSAPLGEAAAGAMGIEGAGTGTLSGLTGALGGGEGIVGWDALGNAVAGGTGEVGSLAGAGAGVSSGAGSLDADLAALLDSPAGGGGSMGDWWAQAISPGSNYTLSDLASIAGLPGTSGSDLIQQLTGGGGTGSNSSISSILSALTGGGGSMTSGSTNPFGGGNLTNLINGLLTTNEYDDQSDWLKATMERAVAASDPYGYGPYRKYAADLLQQSYQNPLAIWQSPEMQAWDTEMQNSQLAKDAAAGQLFNAPERLAQRERGFLTQLKDYRQPLLQMSGSGQPLHSAQAMSAFAGPIVANELAGNAALGATINTGTDILGGMFGLGGTSGGGGFDLSSLLGGLFGGGGGTTNTGWTGTDSAIWDTWSNLGDAWGW
jgi:hypothetical protein